MQVGTELTEEWPVAAVLETLSGRVLEIERVDQMPHALRIGRIDIDPEDRVTPYAPNAARPVVDLVDLIASEEQCRHQREIPE